MDSLGYVLAFFAIWAWSHPERLGFWLRCVRVGSTMIRFDAAKAAEAKRERESASAWTAYSTTLLICAAIVGVIYLASAP